MIQQLKTGDQQWDELTSALTEGLSPTQASRFVQLANNTRQNYLATNPMSKLLMENSSAGTTSAANITDLAQRILPVLRRAMPTTFTQDIVGVQPMSSPRGAIATLRFRYANTAGGARAGQESLTPRHYADLASAYSGNASPNVSASALVSQLEGVLGNSISADVVHQEIEAESRRLQARWTFEAGTDANAMGLDLEAALIERMSTQVAVDTDAEIMERLFALADAPSAQNTYDQANVSGQGVSVVDEFSSLAVLINRVANTVAARTFGPKANIAVVDNDTVSVLESARATGFSRTTVGEFDGAAASTGAKAGTMNGMSLYVDPYTTARRGEILIVSKQDETACPLIYAPYVPLSVVSNTALIDPATGEMVNAVMQRAGFFTANDEATSLGNARDYVQRVGINKATLSFF